MLLDQTHILVYAYMPIPSLNLRVQLSSGLLEVAKVPISHELAQSVKLYSVKAQHFEILANLK